MMRRLERATAEGSEDAGRRGRLGLGLALALVVAAAPAAGLQPADEDARWNDYRQILEVILTTAGDQILPASTGPVMAAATVLGAAPEGFKKGLILRCNTNGNRIQTELLGLNASDPRYAALMTEADRSQAVLSALTGDPEPLRNLSRQPRTPTPTPTPTDAERMRDDEQSHMDDLLLRYGQRADAYAKEADKACEDFAKRKADADAAESDASWSADMARILGAGFDEMERRGSEACRQAKEHDARARAYAVAAHDAEKQVAGRLALAKGQAEACVTVADALAVKAAYEEARRLAARMEKDLAEAVKEQQSAEQRFADHEALQTAWAKVRTTKEGGDNVRALHKTFSERRDALEGHIEGMRNAVAALRSAADKLKELAGQIADSQAHYVKLFPAAADPWAQLEKRAVLPAAAQGVLAESSTALRKRGEALREIFDKTPLFFKLLDMALAACDDSDLAARAIAETSAARDATLLALAAHEHLLALADDCTKRAAAVRPGAVVAASPTPTPPARPPAPGPSPATAPPTSAGGLRIAGRTSLVGGEAAVYTATDGAGAPYASGVTWASSVEDVLIMGADGQAVGFKAGSSVVIAHKDDMTAFLDVEVQARVPMLTGLSAAQAIGRLEGLNLRGGVDNERLRSSGRVAGQTPGPGATLKAGGRVLLRLEKTSAGATAGSPDTGDTASFSTSGGEETPTGGDDFSTTGGETATHNVRGPGPGGGAGEDCETLRGAFEAAVSAGDLGWARAVLERSGHCGFAAAAAATLGERRAQEQAQEAERRREECVNLLDQFNGALGARNVAQAQAVLSTAQDCSFYAQGLEATRNAANQDCEALRLAYVGAMQIRQLARAQWALNAARSKGCSVPDGDVGALAQALEAERASQAQAEQERVQQQMEAMQGFIQGMGALIQGQRRPPSDDNLGPNNLPPSAPPVRPPVSTQPQPTTPTAPQQNCSNVCVQEHTVWYASDGRHATCCPGGVPNPRCVGVTCTRGTVCDRWERRCAP